MSTRQYLRKLFSISYVSIAFFLAACGGGGGSSGGGGTTGQSPSISVQPAANALTAGSAASFNVVATGTGPLSYQWQRDGVKIDDATSATFEIVSVGVADNGAQFRVVVSNALGSVTSDVATLTVAAATTAPNIVSQPTSISVTVGTSANFRVEAAGTAPLTYQWQRDGVDISGATASTYSLVSPTAADSGATFRVVVSNSAGSIVSAAARLTVLAAAIAPSIATAPANVTVNEGQSALLLSSLPARLRYPINGGEMVWTLPARLRRPIPAQPQFSPTMGLVSVCE